MDDRLFNGLIGADMRLLGKKLGGLTLWHVFILHAIESPIMGGVQKPVTPHDLLVLKRVLQASKPDIPNLKPNLRDVWHAIRMKRRPFLDKQVQAVKGWLDVELCAPKFMEKIGGKTVTKGTTATRPRLPSIAVTLAHNLNCSINEAWDMRYAEALWYEAIIAEQNGADISISYDIDFEPPPKLTDEEELELARKSLPPHLFEEFRQSKKKK